MASGEMSNEDWNDVRHIVINKLLDIEYHRRRICQHVLDHEPHFEEKNYHLEEMHKRIMEVENWLEIKRRALRKGPQ